VKIIRNEKCPWEGSADSMNFLLEVKGKSSEDAVTGVFLQL